MQIADMPMVRVFFEKRGRARYTSHLDTMRTMTRALRRSGLPLWYTEGFNPHMYMTFALPIALGFEGLCESVDLRLTEEIPYDAVVARLNDGLPPGFTAIRAAAPAHKPERIAWADYAIRLRTPEPAALHRSLAAFLAQEEIFVDKKTKKGLRQVDIKPLTKLLNAEEEDGVLHLWLRCAAGISTNISPLLLLEAFFAFHGGTVPVRIVREAILCEDLQVFQ